MAHIVALSRNMRKVVFCEGAAARLMRLTAFFVWQNRAAGVAHIVALSRNMRKVVFCEGAAARLMHLTAFFIIGRVYSVCQSFRLYH